MITISLCMIVKNEEQVLARCLESVTGIVDEIIIVDTGSTDSTKEIAKGFTEHVYDFTWVDNFSMARNESFSKATMDYQMWLDADDVILPEDREKLLKLKEELSIEVDMVMMKYNTHFDSNGIPVLTSHRERLCKRENNYQWIDPVHECIPIQGKVYHADITITHRKEKHNDTSDRNLKIYEALEESKKTMTPRQQYYFARELKDHRNFKKSTEYYKLFLNGKEGWIEDNINACFDLNYCYKNLSNQEEQLKYLLKSFEYDAPRPEICCEIGYIYKLNGDFTMASHWFHAAIALNETPSLGFVLRDYWGYIPHIELCVCYDRLGNREKAIYHNEEAAKYKPEDPSVLGNRAYLEANNN